MSAIAERYSRAIRTSDLRVDDITCKDVDVLIAAGMLKETLATRMIRLRAEFDQVRRGDFGVTIAKPDSPRYLVPLLRSWPAARQYLADWAVIEGPVRGVDPSKATSIAEKVLDLFLDPNCPACEGRGFSGGYGLPSLRCSTCRESGRRSLWCRTDVEEAFGRWLQSTLEARIDRALGNMQRLLRQRAID